MEPIIFIISIICVAVQISVFLYQIYYLYSNTDISTLWLVINGYKEIKYYTLDAFILFICIIFLCVLLNGG